MIDVAAWPFWVQIAVFLGAAGVIACSGTLLAGFGDRLADRTGLGEAVTGTLFLGLTTALPGLTASITAALDGRPALALGNAIGGIAIQTTFLAAGDVLLPKANLEHAAASVTNMIQTAILVILLTLVLLGLTGPEVTVGHVHPMTILLFLAVGASFWLVYRSSLEPMWHPKETPRTVRDVPETEHRQESLAKLLLCFLGNAAVVMAAGFLVARTSGSLADATGMSETVAGGLFSGVATSLPELVTTMAAVRRGALTLAVSDIVGGNFFDVLFVFAADLVYFRGSLYHGGKVGAGETFLTALAALLNLVLLLGLLFRQREGPGNIGFESVLIILIYLGGFLTLSFAM
jgi:cation:H+ antiporter